MSESKKIKEEKVSGTGMGAGVGADAGMPVAMSADQFVVQELIAARKELNKVMDANNQAREAITRANEIFGIIDQLLTVTKADDHTVTIAGGPVNLDMNNPETVQIVSLLASVFTKKFEGIVGGADTGAQANK